jgi:serine/threonine protein kinase/tetratricopeptide (TPR) repeat protein
MQCPLCQADNPPSADHCTKCSTPLPLADVTLAPTAMGTAIGGTQAWSVAVTPRPSSEAAAKGQLEPGFLLAERFEILQLLGQGGMGAVYKARDTELERLVALKLIRPELASHPEILRRFKQELILAREVTHRNVIRIFDLGQAQGIKFITMEYVEGRDLKGLIHEKGKLTTDEAVPILLQIAAALDAAHTAGVVHRDLKPQNVMTDKDGRVYVMDFGIARSLEHQGMTQTGALMGTPEYMSPEQAKGEKVDARSDLFALGIIFYEMLTGVSPFKADTAMAMMFKRTQERATPLSQLNLGVPPVISDIVSKCLEIKTDERYQSAREVTNDLEAWKGGVPHSTIVPTSRRIRYAPSYQKWLVVGGALLVLGLGVYLFRDKLSLHSSSGTAAVVQPISLAILPFHNSSTDVSLDWIGETLSDMLSTDVGQSAHLRTVSSDRLHQVLKDLRIPPNSNFGPDALRHLAEYSNADILISGQYAKFGDQIRIDAVLQDLRRDRRVPLKIEAAGEKDIPATIDRLAELIRANLAVSSDVLKELKASSFQPTSQSVPALRAYNQGLQLLRDGKNLDAIKALQDAVNEDPQFALAYSRLASANSNLGYDTDAEQYSRKAVELGQQLPLAEKYLIEASHARVMKDNSKAIVAYENLAKTFPDNPDVEYALAGLYEDSGNFDKALTHYGNILKSDPRNLDALLATGRVQSKRGDPQAGLDSLSRALSIAVQIENAEQQAMVLQATGISYKLLGRSDDALRNYQQSMDINTRLGKKRGVAANLSEIAQVQSRLGRSELALTDYKKALSLQREIGARKEVGDTLINIGQLYEDRGQHDLALQNFTEALQIERDSGDEKYQAYCLNDIGNVHFSKGEYQDALIYFQQAFQLREKLNSPDELAETLSNIGETMAKTGQYDKAIENHLRALDLERKSGDQRGAALDSSSLGALFGYQGRLGAAVNSTSEAVSALRNMKDRSLWMAQALNGYGNALIQAGRGAEAQPILKEGNDLARELKSDSALSEILRSEGDEAYYRGDYKSARPSYQHALEAAQRAKSREDVITAQFSLARIQLQEGDSRRALTAFRGIGEQASAIGLKYVSLESSMNAAQALLHDKNYPDAIREAQRVLTQSEPQSLRMLMARTHQLLGTALRSSGNSAEAANHFRDALRIWDDVRKEPGAEKTLDRLDLKSFYDEATQALAAKN